MSQLDFFSRLIERLKPKPVALPEGADAELTARCGDWLMPMGYAELAGRVRVCWSSRMRSTAGMAYPKTAMIKLNPRLREFGDDEIDRTLRHELAHLLAHHRVGRRKIAPHGREWRRACTDLGLNDEKRCHTLPLPRRTVERRHAYRCPSCESEIRRVRPFRRATACLACCRKHSSGRYDERFRFVKMRCA
ncbi:MAG: SprT-like domain-containing protein [Chthoniobacteraceae bacterium]